MTPGVYGPDDQQSISNAGEFSLKRRSMSRRTMLAGLGGFALTAGIAGTAVFHGFGITKTPNDDAFLGSSIAASPTADISGPATMQRLVINVTSEPKSFDFNKDPYCGGDEACFARLCQFDENMLVKPDIAEKWESNWDASVWTFYLRDSKWSNGESVTAHDFEYSFKRQLDPATKSPSPAFLYRLKNGEAFNQCNGSVTADDVGVVATDDKTLLVTLENPYVYFPVIAAIAASTPAYQPAVEQHGDTWTEPENIVCNGPFVLTEWKHHVSYTLKRNDNYWNAGNITLTEVYRPIFSSDEAIHVYREGQLDIALNGSFDNGPQIQIDDPLNDDYFTFNKFGTWYLEPNVNMAPFDVKEVRLAMAHAVDRETIVNKVLHGLAMPAYTMTPPGMPGHDQNTFSEYTVYDPEQAMALLKGTRYEGGKNWPSLTMTQRDGEGIAPVFAAEAMIAMLEENLGMKIQQRTSDPDKTYADAYAHKVQLMWWRWYVDYPDPSCTLFLPWYSRQTTDERNTFSNQELDRLLVTAAEQNDVDVRMRMYQQADQIIAENGAATFVYHPYHYGLKRPWVKGMPTDALGNPMPNWYLYCHSFDRIIMMNH